MAILHSCCFWKSVRKGSYASAIYALVYFGSSCTIISVYLYDEQKYLTGEVDKPTGESFLEKDAISPTTVIFNILLLICASCGFISSILIIIALRKNRKELLIPWILFMITDLLIECLHFIYIVIIKTLDFEPLTATLFTVDFFIICLNVYCLLCVISQYQEYKAGRGYATDDNRHETPQHSPPSPTGAYLNTFRHNRDKRNFSTYPRPNFTRIGTIPPATSPSRRHARNSSLKKKHVQFPDNNEHSCIPSFKSTTNKTEAEKVLIDIIPENNETTLS